MATEPDELRRRVLDATFDEVAERGLASLTVEAVAARAGTSRATLYRRFPGGRDELVDRTIRRELDRFVTALLADAPPVDDPVAHVAGLLRGARSLLVRHAVLQRLLLDEAEAIVPPLATLQPLVHEAIAAHLAQVVAVAGLVEAGEPAVEAGDHAARMLLSYLGSPGGADLDDPAAVEDLVRRRIVPWRRKV